MHCVARKDDMPKVSVVVPVFNAGRYLSECLDSILGQSLTDIEVLAVDDGSTDGSLGILDHYAERDSRVTVLSQENAGAAAARNRGLEAASGEYLSFLDADDFFESTMLEDACGRGDADAADICLYGGRLYNNRTGRYRSAGWFLRTAFVPEKRPFSRQDIPDHILLVSSPAPWNKLLRRTFVLAQGLRFQEIERSEDLLFARLAMVRAERITVVDKRLVNYRIGHELSLQATNHETPLEFYKALLELRQELRRAGQFDEVERSFVNDALSICLYNLNSLKTPDAYGELYNRLRADIFAELGLLDHDREYFFWGKKYQQMLSIASVSPTAHLMDEAEILRRRMATLSGQVTDAKAGLELARSEISRMQRSLTYRIARKLRRVVRGVRPSSATMPVKAV